MAFGITPLEKRLKDNIKNYKLAALYELDSLYSYLRSLSNLSGLEFLLTDRHGERAVCVGDFIGFVPDVVNEPGEKVRVMNRTIGHLYVKGRVDDANHVLVKAVVEQLSQQGFESYAHIETSIYADELEELLEKEQFRVKHGEKTDALTGTLNSTHFHDRMKGIDDSETAPVAAICVNINDWKVFNDHFGDEESDRLIQIVASILKEEAGEEYIIGRCGGDCFNVLIPNGEYEDAKVYSAAIKRRCEEYEDAQLIVSIACGIAMKTNVEEKLNKLLEEAEYEMFSDKVEIKNKPDYRERFKHLLYTK